MAALAVATLVAPLASGSAQKIEEEFTAQAEALIDDANGSRGDGYRLTDADLSDFVEDNPTALIYPAPLLDGWRGALKRELAQDAKGKAASRLRRAAERLGGEHGIAPKAMEQLTRLWLAAQLHRFDFDGESAQGRFRSRVLEAAVKAGPAPLVDEIAAHAINEVLDCDAETFDALVSHSSDPVATGWRVANVAPCMEIFMRFAERFPERNAPALIRQAHWGALAPPATLPLYGWVASDAGLAHVAEVDRDRVRTWLLRQLGPNLFGVGLDARAVELLDGLPKDLRSAVLAPRMAGFTATIDGLEVHFEPDPGEGLGLELAIAYFNAGRQAEAETLLATLPMLDRARAQFECAWQASLADTGLSSECRDSFGEIERTIDALILDKALHDPAADPYPLAEAGFSGSRGNPASGPSAALRCRYFAEPQYADICRPSRRAVLERARLEPGHYLYEDSARIIASLDALGLPGWREHRDAYAAETAAVIARHEAEDLRSGRRRRESVDPVTPPFAVHPLPAEARSRRESARARDELPEWPRGWAELPRGFVPVRWDRSGQRAVAVSVSPLLDPSGEISAGGYWVHLSDDGGTSWQAPRYTGLAELFPYMVQRRSKLPLIAGDRLHLEVAVAELDTASITYPPVALRTRRTETDLYLEIPLVELSRDSDGDGLTDLVESHLLLDLPPGEAPFVIGSDDPANCSDADAGMGELRLTILAQISGIDEAALIEPVDRAGNDPLAGAWRRVEKGEDWPLFLKGDRRDFACLAATGRPMLVYGEAGEAELQRRTPDFRLIEMPRFVMNRAGDRGYVVWSAGWTGGTLRVRRTAEGWEVNQLSTWIT